MGIILSYICLGISDPPPPRGGVPITGALKGGSGKRARIPPPPRPPLTQAKFPPTLFKCEGWTMDQQQQPLKQQPQSFSFVNILQCFSVQSILTSPAFGLSQHFSVHLQLSPACQGASYGHMNMMAEHTNLLAQHIPCDALTPSGICCSRTLLVLWSHAASMAHTCLIWRSLDVLFCILVTHWPHLLLLTSSLSATCSRTNNLGGSFWRVKLVGKEDIFGCPSN